MSNEKAEKILALSVGLSELEIAKGFTANAVTPEQALKAMQAYADKQVKEAKEYSELEKSYDFAQAKKIKAENERLREGIKNYLIELKQGVTDLYPPNTYIEKFEQLLNPSDDE